MIRIVINDPLPYKSYGHTRAIANVSRIIPIHKTKWTIVSGRTNYAHVVCIQHPVFRNNTCAKYMCKVHVHVHEALNYTLICSHSWDHMHAE